MVNTECAIKADLEFNCTFKAPVSLTDNKKHIWGIILAGGKSLRFGRNKARRDPSARLALCRTYVPNNIVL